MIRAIFVVFAMLLSVLSAYGQALSVLERIGASPAARQLALRMPRQSSTAMAILEQLGIKATSEEAAVIQWRSLSNTQLGAVISRNNDLTRLYLGSSLIRPEDRALWGSTIDTIRVHKLDDSVIKSLQSHQPLTLDQAFTDPLVPCDERCRAIFARAGKYSAGAAAGVPLSISIDTLVERQQKKQ